MCVCMCFCVSVYTHTYIYPFRSVSLDDPHNAVSKPILWLFPRFWNAQLEQTYSATDRIRILTYIDSFPCGAYATMIGKAK